MKIKLSKIQHIGIPVNSLEKSLCFYERLGFKNIMSSNFVHENGEGQVVMMQSDEIIVELYQLPKKNLKEVCLRQHGHIDHIAFNVEDIDKLFEELKSRDFTIIEDSPVYLPFWKKGCKYFYIVGPNGERLEFNQIL